MVKKEAFMFKDLKKYILVAVIGLILAMASLSASAAIVDSKGYSSLSSALAKVGSSGTLVLTSNLSTSGTTTIPATVSVSVLKGGTFTKSSGTLAILGYFDAGLNLVFSGYSAGDVTFGAGNVKEVYPEWWGAIGTTKGSVGSSPNQSIALQCALSAASDRVKFTKIFNVRNVLKVSSSTELAGLDRENTGIQTDLDIELLNNIDTTQSLINFRMTKMLLKNIYPVTGGAGSTKFHAHLTNCLLCIIDNCKFEEATVDSDFNVNNHGGVWLDKNAYQPQSWINIIQDSFFSESQILMEVTDSHIINNWVYGIPCDYSIKVNAANNLVEGNDTQNNPSNTNHGAIWVTTNGATSRIIGNFFDTNSNPGLNLNQAFSTVISSNTFWHNQSNAIIMNDGSYNTITGNTFLDNNALNNFYSDILISDVSFGSSHNIVTDNTFYQSASRTNKGYAIEEKNSGAAAVANTYFPNAISSLNYPSPAIKVLSDAVGVPFSFTPILNAAGGSPTVGNGTLTGTLMKVGNGGSGFKWLATIKLTLGSTTSLGTGGFWFTLPESATVDCVGRGFGYFTGTGIYYEGAASIGAGSANVSVISNGATGSWSNVVPVTWQSGSSITLTVEYM